MNATSHTHKMIEYSYPTSINAKQFGFYSTGCWTIELVDPTHEELPLAIAGYATKQQAFEAFDKMPQAESKFMKYIQR